MEILNGVFNHSCGANFSATQILQRRLVYHNKVTTKEQHLNILDWRCSEQIMDWDTPNTEKSDVSFLCPKLYYET